MPHRKNHALRPLHRSPHQRPQQTRQNQLAPLNTQEKKTTSPDWQLTQCLFGEHLLPQHPDKTVALVESEKTAIICSAMMPQYLWLATGGKSGLTSEHLTSLKGRKIIVFPDIDAFKDWQQKIFTFPHLDIRISRLLEDNATPADRAAHIDLADWILKYLEINNN